MEEKISTKGGERTYEIEEGWGRIEKRAKNQARARFHQLKGKGWRAGVDW